jgi:hypothetical protein
MNRYVLSDIYPNIIYDKAAQKHLSMAEVLQILNNDEPSTMSLFNYVNKRFFK